MNLENIFCFGRKGQYPVHPDILILDENLIDKAFDEIACQEVIYANQGYSDGLITGYVKQCREGHVLGLKKGFELGSEIGEYRGFALVSLKYLTTEDRANELTPKQKKCVKVLEKIIKSTEEVPSTNLHPNNDIGKNTILNNLY